MGLFVSQFEVDDILGCARRFTIPCGEIIELYTEVRVIDVDKDPDHPYLLVMEIQGPRHVTFEVYNAIGPHEGIPCVGHDLLLTRRDSALYVRREPLSVLPAPHECTTQNHRPRDW